LLGEACEACGFTSGEQIFRFNGFRSADGAGCGFTGSVLIAAVEETTGAVEDGAGAAEACKADPKENLEEKNMRKRSETLNQPLNLR
jgi:hypothetical protein